MLCSIWISGMGRRWTSNLIQFMFSNVHFPFLFHSFTFGINLVLACFFLAPDGRLQEDCRWLPPPIANERDLT
jgi:hypothetical protein